MKTILLPTDYSETAENASEYAFELAAYSKARLVLLHVFHVPVPTSEVPLITVTPQELERENKERLAKLENTLRERSGGKIQIESIVKSGFAVHEIVETAAEVKADCIVMGVTGMSKLGEALIGSVTTSVMHKTRVPVLVIPQGASFTAPEKIVFACNYEEKLDETVIDRFKAIVKLFKSKVLVLDVVKSEELASYEKAVAGIGLEHSLRDIPHELHFPEGEDITRGINLFIDRHHAGMLVMVPFDHRSLTGLFHRSNTKKMAFHTHVPLLSIHN